MISVSAARQFAKALKTEARPTARLSAPVTETPSDGRGASRVAPIILEDCELESVSDSVTRNMCSVDCCPGAGWPEFGKKSTSTPSRPSSDQKSDEKASISGDLPDLPSAVLHTQTFVLFY